MYDDVKALNFPGGIGEIEFYRILAENKLVIVEMFTNYGGLDVIFVMETLSKDEFNDIVYMSIDSAEARWIGKQFSFEIGENPTVLFFKDEKLVEKHVGFMKNEEFLATIKEK